MPNWIICAGIGVFCITCFAIEYAAMIAGSDADDRDELILTSDYPLSDGERVRDRTERRRLAYKAWSDTKAGRLAECRTKFESEAG